MPLSTEAVIRNHLQAAPRGADAVMQDFAEDSVLVTPDATYRGCDAIRRFYESFLGGLPPGFFGAFALYRLEVVGEVGYILWGSPPSHPLVTDTFVVRDGRIRVQTFAAAPAAGIQGERRDRAPAQDPAVPA